MNANDDVNEDDEMHPADDGSASPPDEGGGPGSRREESTDADVPEDVVDVQLDASQLQLGTQEPAGSPEAETPAGVEGSPPEVGDASGTEEATAYELTMGASADPQPAGDAAPDLRELSERTDQARAVVPAIDESRRPSNPSLDSGMHVGTETAQGFHAHAASPVSRQGEPIGDLRSPGGDGRAFPGPIVIVTLPNGETTRIIEEALAAASQRDQEAVEKIAEEKVNYAFWVRDCQARAINGRY